MILCYSLKNPSEGPPILGKNASTFLLSSLVRFWGPWICKLRSVISNFESPVTEVSQPGGQASEELWSCYRSSQKRAKSGTLNLRSGFLLGFLNSVFMSRAFFLGQIYTTFVIFSKGFNKRVISFANLYRVNWAFLIPITTQRICFILFSLGGLG